MQEKTVNEFIREHLLKDVLIREYWSNESCGKISA